MEVFVYTQLISTSLFGIIDTFSKSKFYSDLMRLLFVNSIGSPVLGVGFTGSLASTHPKLGDHRYLLSNFQYQHDTFHGHMHTHFIL